MPKMNANTEAGAEAAIIDAVSHLHQLRSVARLTLGAVKYRHECDGDLQINVEALQATMTLLSELCKEIDDGKDQKTGRWAIDIVNDGIGMQWYQTRGLIALLDCQAWQMLEENAAVPDPSAIDDIEHALQALCALIPSPSDLTRKLARTS
ncbi:MAG: hypothetical protein M0Z99_30995 [Betaproteobacteria bacterium]|nr:hypothetical protein [Betaproteobacteria bacterium]